MKRKGKEMTVPTVKHDYSNSDVLLYLINRSCLSIDAAIEEICGVSTDHMVDIEDLPPHLETAVAILMTAQRELRTEKLMAGLRRTRVYSNGVPTEYQYEGEPVTDPEGNTYRQTASVNVHPSGRIDVPIPEDQQPWWWRKEE